MSNLKQDGLYNLKIHYIWTFFSSFLFLSPIITLYYQYWGLDIRQILVLSSVYFIFSVILEIPTSLIGDSLPRRYILRASVICSLVSFLIYAFFPSQVMFYIAVFFSALGHSLWSGVGHSKLQEDLEAAGLAGDFGKIIGKLIALQNIGKLLTPFGIYFILKYFPNGYQILAILDVISWSIATFFVFRFRQVNDVNLLKGKTLSQSVYYQIGVFKKAVNYLFSNNNLKRLLIVVVLTSDFGYLSKIILPDLVSSGIKNYLTSYVVWFSVLAGIVGNLLQGQIAKKLGYEKLFRLVIFLNFILYLIASFLIEDKFLFSLCFVLISFNIGMWYPIWNHIFMQETNIQEKATVRSLFIMILSLFSGIILFISSFISIKIMLLIFSLLMLMGFLIFILT